MEITKKRKESSKNAAIFAELQKALQRGSQKKITSLLTSNPSFSIADQVDAYKVIHTILRNPSNDLASQAQIIINLKLLLDTGADVNITDDTGKTALHLAIANRMTQVIDFLISHGADWHVRDKFGNSILHFLINSEFRKFEKYTNILDPVEKQAFEKQSTDFIEWLISKTSRDVDFRNKKEETALHLAARYNLLHVIPILLKYTMYSTIYDYLSMTAFQIFIESAVCGIIQKNSIGRAPIPMSNYEPDYVQEICEKFLAKGFSVDVTDVMNTPLHYVLKNRKRNYAKLMLKYVKKVDARSSDGNTALNIIMNYSRLNSEGFEKDDEDMARVLLSKEADVYVLNNKCSSPLISAVTNRKLNMLNMFKEYKADFNRLYRTGNLLHYFLKSDIQTDAKTYEAVFDLLINQGCDVNAKDEKGMTPLHLAAACGETKTVEKLIERGANVHSRESDRWYSALHVAVEHDHACLLEVLVKSGADVNAKTKAGQTALHLECRDDAVKKLMKLGARLDVADKAGFLPLQIAIQRGNVRAMESLLRFGADIDDNSRVLNLNDVVSCPAISEHLIRLKAAGLPMDEKLERVLKYVSNAAPIRERCVREIESLKSYRFNATTSLYDLLRMNRNYTCTYVDNEKLKRLVGSSTFEKQFPMYHVLISSTYHMAVDRRKLLEPARFAWMELTKIQLPDVCIYEILSHLSNMSLRLMAKKKKKSRGCKRNE